MMVTTTLDSFCADVGMLLRDHPLGTAARLTQHIIAWWDGRSVVFAYLREENESLIEEEFDPLELSWSEWSAEFVSWLARRVFERFDEIERWILESPPHEGGRIE
jgi:hypothetical protein